MQAAGAAVSRPVSSWLLRGPFLRRFASGKGHHGEVKAHDSHGHGNFGPYENDHVRHFEGPGEVRSLVMLLLPFAWLSHTACQCVPFPTYPQPNLWVGMVYWGYLAAPIVAGILCLQRAKYVLLSFTLDSLHHISPICCFPLYLFRFPASFSLQTLTRSFCRASK